MPTFDTDKYFASKLAASTGNQKLHDLIAASAEKRAEMTARSQALDTQIAQSAITQAADSSWVAKLGLDPGGFVANRVNDAASLVSGASRLIGQTVSLPVSLAGGLASMSATAEDYAAYNQVKLGKATPEDFAQLNQVSSEGGPTILQRLQYDDEQRGTARGVNDFFKLDGIVNQANRQGLSEDLVADFQPNWDKVKSGEIGQMASGAAGLAANAGKAIWNNPSAVREYVLENAPQLLLGAAGKAGQAAMAASNVGYATDVGQQGLENYAKTHEGQLPPLDQQRTMWAKAGTLALAEEAADVFSLGAARAAKAAARTTFINSVNNVGKASAKGFAAEAPTEGYQTYMEGDITQKPATALDIYQGAVIGGASGGGLTGGMRTVHEAAVLASQPGATKVDTPMDPKITEAISTGKVDHLLNPKADNYDPEAAIRALFGHSQQEGTTEETKVSNLAKADDILSKLSDEFLTVQERLTTPEQLQAKVAKYKAVLAKTDPADTARVARLQSAIEGAEQDITTPLDGAVQAHLQAQATKLERLTGQATAARDNLALLVQPKATVDALVQAADQAMVTGEDNTPAVRKIITLAMASPGFLDPEQATRLADNMSNALTEPQRTMLRAFSDARISENKLMSLGGVSADIFTGHKNKGIAQYRLAIGNALATSNKKAADREMFGLENFSEDHAAKAAAVTQAYTNFQEDGQHRVVRSDGQQGWFVEKAPRMAEALRAKEGALNIGDGAAKLAHNMPLEAEAITKAAVESRAAYDLKFNPGASNVSHISQEKAGTKAHPAVTQVRPVVKAGPGSTAIDPGVVSDPAGARTPTAGVVETAGIDLPTGTLFDEISDPDLKLNLYRGEGAGNNTDGGWWTFKKSEAEQYAAVNGGKVRTLVMTTYEIGKKTTQGHLSPRHRLFAEKADVGRVVEKPVAETAAVAVTGVNSATTVKQEPNGSSQVVKSNQITEKLETSTVEIQSTEDTTVQDEKTTDTAEKGSDAPASVKPGLAALQQGREFNKQFAGKKLGEVFRQLNRAAAWLTQRQPKVTKDADILAARPLVDIQNLLVQWNDGAVTPTDFFPGGLTETQEAALEAFRETVTKWFESARTNFIHGSLLNSKGNQIKSEWAFKDPLQDFFTQDPKTGVWSIDPNIVTAVTYAGYSWFAESASGPARKTNEGVLAMHGLKEGQGFSVNTEGGAALRLMAATRDMAITSLGVRVLEALGLSERPGVGVTQEYLSVVTAAFGAHALRLLEEQHLVESETLDGGDLNAYIDGMNHQPVGYKQVGLDENGDPVDVAIYEKWHYVKINRQEDLSLVPTGQQIKDASSGSQGVLNKLFGSTRPLREATIKPAPFLQEKAKRTDQAISSEQREVLEAAQEVPHRVIKSMWGALQVLGDNVFLTAAGARENANHLVQYENRDAVETQNEALIHQLDLAKELVQPHADKNFLEQAFFVTQEAWRNFRAGIVTQNLNMQSSKIHRAIFFRPEWEATIRLDDPVAMEQFQVGLAQALGIKVDTQPNAQTIELLQAFLANPSHRIVELALKLHKDNENVKNPDKWLMTEAEKELIGEFAAEREGMQTLQAVVALGEYFTALQTGNESAEFTVHMLVGADGKTNGPMLTILALGAATTVAKLFGYLTRGGFYRESDGVSNFSHWYDPTKKQDLYQDFAGKIIQKLNMGSPKTAALQVITKNLLKDGGVTSAARNLAKTPQTGFNFGSSIEKAVLGMQESLVQAVFDRIETVATGEDNWVKVPELITSINAFIAQPALQIPVGTGAQGLLDMKFSLQQKKALLSGFGQLLGPAVEEAMEEYYGTLIERRNALNKSVQASFHIYDVIYTDLRQQEMQRLMDEGDIAFQLAVDKNGKPKLDAQGKSIRTPLHDMTVPQEKALIERVKPLLPLAHTAYSKDEGNLDAGLLMAKTKRTKGAAAFYDIKVQMGRKFTNSEGRETSHMLTTGMEQVWMSPGVAALAYFMHSLDSAVMHRSIAGTESMNVHDEAANAADKINKTAGAINASLWSTMLKFSPTTETLDLLGRSVTNSIPLLESGDLPKSTLVVLADMLRSTLPGKRGAAWGKKTTATVDLALAALSLAKQNQYDAETIRLTGMSQMTVVDQYTWEGGEYRVTESDRAEAKAQLDAHLKAGPALDPVLVQAALTFGKLLTQAGEAKPQVSERAVIEQEPEIKPTPKDTAVVSSSSNSVLEAFKKTPKMSGKDALTAAWLAIQKDTSIPTNMRAFYGKLMPRMAKLLPNDQIIEYVNSQEKFDALVELGIGPPEHMGMNIYGWNVSDAKRIFLMGETFAVSKVNSEVVVHELLHAITASIISGAKKGTPEYALVQDMEYLLTQVREAVAKMPQDKQTQFAPALENVHELLAWGMANAAFQTEVLLKINVKTTAYPNKLITAAQAFAEALVNFFFKGSPGTMPWEYGTGMESLINNVAGLMEVNNQEQSNTGQPQTLAMAAPQSQTEAAIDAINTYSTLDILHAMDNGTLDPSFQGQLRDLLGGIVQKLHGPFGSFMASMRKTEAGNPLAVWLKALETGKAPFSSSILASGFTGNNQQDFVIQQVEATVRTSFTANDVTTRSAYRELDQLFHESAARLKPSDFLGGTWATHTLAEATALYDFVFDVQKSNGDRSDYLSRFAALGLAHQGFNALLKAPTAAKTLAKGRSIVQRLNDVFHSILEFFHGRLNGTYKGQHADEKLNALVNHLVDIEAKERYVLTRKQTNWGLVMEKVEEASEGLVQIAHRKIAKTLGSDVVRNHKNIFVRATFSLLRSATRSRIDGFLQAVVGFRDAQTKGQQGLLAGLITNVKNPVERFKLLLMATKLGERKRAQEGTHTAKFVRESFVNQGRDLSKQAKAAITSVFLRTGLHALVGPMTLVEIEHLMGNRTALDKAIDTFKSKLDEFGTLKDSFSLDANYLGYHKVTGHNPNQFLKQNATQIARQFGSAQSLTDVQVVRAVEVITPLIALYALRYLSDEKSTAQNPSALGLARELLRVENKRPADQNHGVEFTLQLARHLEAEALDKLFKGDPSLMVHGYTPEVYNYRTLLASANEVDGKELIRLGYIKGGVVQKDPADPDREVKHLYRLKDGGLPPHTSGALVSGSNRAKGSLAHGSYMNLVTVNGIANQVSAAAIQSHRAQSIAKTTVGNPDRDVSQERENFMAPLFTDTGTVANWRYLMADSTKDTLLERTNDFDKLIGTLAGTIQSKPAQLDQNKLAIQGMLDQYNSEYATRGDSYEEISPKSSDPEMRKIWALLPEQTKADVREIWGSDKLMVRSDSLDMLFGYSKVQASAPIQRAYEERQAKGLVHDHKSLSDLQSINVTQKVVIGVAEMLMYQHARSMKRMSHEEAQHYTKRLGHWVATGENIWQAIVHETKDILIVKTGATMVGNILSNFSMLWLQGVPIDKMITDSFVAWRAASEHKTVNDELAQLRAQLVTGTARGRDEEIKRRIRILENALEINPATRLINEGLMPTIVEDLTDVEDVYSYKSLLTRKVDGLTGKLNPALVKAGRIAYMSHDTSLYKGLAHVTQMSDFLARYVLYQHQTTRKKDPLSHKEAVLRASDAFVNYDIPMHRMMQYFDDMGFTTFTKYFLYIQKELWRVGQEQPSRLYALMTLGSFLSFSPTVLDSGVLSNMLDNPVRGGAFSFAGSLDQLLTAKAALAVVQ